MKPTHLFTYTVKFAYLFCKKKKILVNYLDYFMLLVHQRNADFFLLYHTYREYN